LSPLSQRGDTKTGKESDVPQENLPQTESVSFEGLKEINDYGAEYWSARDLQPSLGYNHWRSFESAVKK
jgi:DNA-damage-inducible protein D